MEAAVDAMTAGDQLQHDLDRLDLLVDGTDSGKIPDNRSTASR
jgi:hypothetical protein